MTIEIYNKGKLVGKIILNQKIDVDDLQMAVIYQSKMRCDEKVEINLDLPQIHKIEVPEYKRKVTKEIPGKEQNVIIKSATILPLVRARAVFSNARPYDQLDVEF